MTGFSKIASGEEDASSHEIESRSVGPMRAMAKYPAQLISHSRTLSRKESSRSSETDFCGGSAATGEELTKIFYGERCRVSGLNGGGQVAGSRCQENRKMQNGLVISSPWLQIAFRGPEE